MWEAAPDNVKYGGTWCPYCSGLLGWSLEKLQEYAEQKGGLCLATEYKALKYRVQWECADGHRWWRSPISMIPQGQWCPKCHIYISEEICQTYFETLFGVLFPKSRPAWLISPKNRRMELDGYNQDLRIAFEHHGKHHYEKGYIQKPPRSYIFWCRCR